MEGHMKGKVENHVNKLILFIEKHVNKNIKEDYFSGISILSSILDDLTKEKIPFSVEGKLKVPCDKGKYSVVNFDISRNLDDVKLATGIVKNPISLPEHDLTFIVSIVLVKEQNVYFREGLEKIKQKYPYLNLEEIKFSDPLLDFLYSDASFYKSKEMMLNFNN